MAKKILLFSPPFNGHLNVLKNLIWKYRNYFDFHLVITGWKNIQPNLKGVTVPVTILAHSDLNETDPAIWTFPRIIELFDDCLDLIKKERPDLIIYDFFSLEGNLAGKILGVPYWSSIPALVGPSNTDYLKTKLGLSKNVTATDDIEKKFPGALNLSHVETISDGFHIPGQTNLIWSYPALTPIDFMTNRRSSSYNFVGHLDTPMASRMEPETQSRPLVYFSLGTVVMNNLWNQQIAVREKLKTFIGRLAELWKDRQINVLFVSQGKSMLNSYPSNWKVVTYADQVSVLSQASVFITHAGGNSFHEAVLKKVPMVAIPFFGDQPLVASQIEKLGLGVNLVTDSGIDTRKSKDFINASLADKVDGAVTKIVNNLEGYKNKFSQLSLESQNIFELLNPRV
ncbi:MAG TPA: glycosyltransferase [Candidatus Paceibacterota bacterium]